MRFYQLSVRVKFLITERSRSNQEFCIENPFFLLKSLILDSFSEPIEVQFHKLKLLNNEISQSFFHQNDTTKTLQSFSNNFYNCNSLI